MTKNINIKLREQKVIHIESNLLIMERVATSLLNFELTYSQYERINNHLDDIETIINED